MEMEHIGKLHLKELCGRSFFQHLDDAEEYFTLSQGFEMHDLVHDLASSIIQYEYLMISCNTEIIADQRMRHFMIDFTDGHGQRIIKILKKLKKVLPSSIGTLKHLRYLDLELEELPRDIRNLVSLRTLYITTKQTSFPENGTTALPKWLQGAACTLQSLIIVDCPKLAAFPGDATAHVPNTLADFKLQSIGGKMQTRNR
ncbi:hypothetical protein TIFTF001_004750 [Ficus carica]|uniref:Disease resistance protein winged helix domain-containing protein n=1 Tax=Ficus carica TaxID=3494 RepID=A0AA88CYD5_FICCA|nr:hypothetical protein TIFTF001_004750 [Ficus carica]